MKPKLLLGLALVLSGGWFGSASAAETTNTANATPTPKLANTLKLVWTPATNTFFSFAGPPVEMQNAEQGVYEGRFESGEVWHSSVIAFVNPHDQKAYVVQAGLAFYVENGSDVIGASQGLSCLYWYPSYVASTNGIERAIAEFEQKFNIEEIKKRMTYRLKTSMEFSDEFDLALGPTPRSPGIVNVSVKDGIVRLDLRPREENMYASLWVDTKNLRVVKYIETGHSKDGPPIPIK